MRSGIAWRWLAGLVAVVPVGCQGVWPRPSNVGDGSGSSLRIGLGWSSASSPEQAGRAAVRTALQQVGKARPDLVLVWDNWPAREQAEQVLAGVARHVPPRTIYGGQVTWPVASEWLTQPTVTVLVLAGGWQVTAAAESDVFGRERQAGRSLGGKLSTGDGSAGDADDEGVRPSSRQPLTLLFTPLDASRADRLVSGLAERLAEQAVLFGGSGSGAGGGGWQYVAGRLADETVWAVRLDGAFRARALRVSGRPEAESITEAAALAGTLLSRQLVAEGSPWRLVLMVPSAGWLALVKQPEQLALNAAERLAPAGPPGQEAGRALVAGWAGDAQIGPDPREPHLPVGQFDLAMVVIEPVLPDGEAEPTEPGLAVPADTRPANTQPAEAEPSP